MCNHNYHDVVIRCVIMMFSEFCETTGLHGWKYLAKVIFTMFEPFFNDEIKKDADNQNAIVEVLCFNILILLVLMWQASQTVFDLKKERQMKCCRCKLGTAGTTR